MNSGRQGCHWSPRSQVLQSVCNTISILPWTSRLLPAFHHDRSADSILGVYPLVSICKSLQGKNGAAELRVHFFQIALQSGGNNPVSTTDVQGVCFFIFSCLLWSVLEHVNPKGLCDMQPFYRYSGCIRLLRIISKSGHVLQPYLHLSQKAPGQLLV